MILFILRMIGKNGLRCEWKLWLPAIDQLADWFFSDMNTWWKEKRCSHTWFFLCWLEFWGFDVMDFNDCHIHPFLIKNLWDSSILLSTKKLFWILKPLKLLNWTNKSFWILNSHQNFVCIQYGRWCYPKSNESNQIKNQQLHEWFEIWYP